MYQNTLSLILLYPTTLHAEGFCQTGIYAGEAHKGHGQEAGSNKGYCHTLHATGDVHHREVFTDAGKDYHCQGKAKGCGNGIDNTGEEIRFQALCVVGSLCHKDGTGNLQHTGLGT